MACFSSSNGFQRFQGVDPPVLTIRSHGANVAKNHLLDWLILLILVVVEVILVSVHPFYRYVGKDMMTDLRFPFKDNTVPVWSVPLYAVILPVLIFLIVYIRRRDVYDLHHAVLGLLFSVLITAIITDAIKNGVGRPRPNFFWRCFPDGIEIRNKPKQTISASGGFGLLQMVSELDTGMCPKGVDCKIPHQLERGTKSFLIKAYDGTGNVICHGKESEIREGHKSFPSGHTSWSFAGLGFLAFYISGKIQAFDGRGHVAKLCLVFLLLLGAALVGVSRVDDYWHHWQDVFAGAIIGLVVSGLCYLQFFPPPYSGNGWGPYAYFKAHEEHHARANATARSAAIVDDVPMEEEQTTPNGDTYFVRTPLHNQTYDQMEMGAR